MAGSALVTGSMIMGNDFYHRDTEAQRFLRFKPNPSLCLRASVVPS